MALSATRDGKSKVKMPFRYFTLLFPKNVTSYFTLLGLGKVTTRNIRNVAKNGLVSIFRFGTVVSYF